MQIDLCAAFAMVNHQIIPSMLWSVGVASSVLSKLTQFLSNRSQLVMVDGCWSKLVNFVSGVLHGSVSGPLCSCCTDFRRLYLDGCCAITRLELQ